MEKKESVVTTDECVTQGDCVVCGATNVKGKLEKFPVCYNCYSTGEGAKWVINTSKQFLGGVNETIDEVQLKKLPLDQQAKFLMELCQKYIKVKKD